MTAAMDKYVRDYEALYNRSQKLTELLNEQVCKKYEGYHEKFVG